VRNSPIYATASININNLAPLYYIFSHIYIKNPFNLNFISLNYLIKNILTFIAFISLILASKAALLLYNLLTTLYNYATVTIYNPLLLPSILISPYLNIIATDNNATALGSILLNLLCLS